MMANPLAEETILCLASLPDQVVEILKAIDAPARLVAHLRLVHDVAMKLIEALKIYWPDLPFDANVVLFGAATHDIGKASHTKELFEPGTQHETVGPDILMRHGVPNDLARFARTHNAWKKEKLRLEDLLVAIADTCWKGKRVDELERLTCREISRRLSIAEWEATVNLSDILEQLAVQADRRLEWQGQF